MAEKDNTFQNTVEALFRGMDSFITTKTVVGEAIHIDDTILLPLVDVSFGVGAGAFAENAKNNAGGGMGGKISPSAVLVISKNGCCHQNHLHCYGSDQPLYRQKGRGRVYRRESRAYNKPRGG